MIEVSSRPAERQRAMFWHAPSISTLSRRHWLQLGAGVAVAPWLGRTSPADDGVATFGRAKRCLCLFLTGGPPQIDTWDPKPHAPLEIRGDLGAIRTAAPGLEIGELFPRVAQQADKLCVVRSVTHGDNTHTSAGYTMLTGVRHPLANAPTAKLIKPTPEDHPHVGALAAKLRGAPAGRPAFAAIPEAIRDAGINEFPGQNAGFLGPRFDPLQVEHDAGSALLRVPDLSLAEGVTRARLERRRELQQGLDARRMLEAAPIRAWDDFYAGALDLLDSPAVRGAMAIEREPAATRAAYGEHLFGRGCLLARRLLEAGVPFVTVYWHYEGPDDSPVWDTHGNNFAHLRQRLAPPADRAVSAVLDDFSSRGLLDDTLVCCFGEFGRSPRINRNGGRDHWSALQSLLVAGAGIRGGTVFGASDRQGAYPADNPVTPADWMATWLHLLGIPPDSRLHDRAGREHPACTGEVIAGLVG